MALGFQLTWRGAVPRRGPWPKPHRPQMALGAMELFHLQIFQIISLK